MRRRSNGVVLLWDDTRFMPKIQIHSERSYGGARFLDFTIDGKPYVAVPKMGSEQSWLDEFKKLLGFSAKYNLNPFATPIKADPVKSDKYKNMRSYDRLKYSWNTDNTIKGQPHSGLKDYIDVVPKDKINTYLEQRRPPEAVQTKMVLSNLIDVLIRKGLPKTAERLKKIAPKL